MFRWVVLAALVVLILSYLLPIVLRSGKQTAKEMFEYGPGSNPPPTFDKPSPPSNPPRIEPLVPWQPENKKAETTSSLEEPVKDK